MKYVNESILKKVYKQRESWTRKGQFGRLVIIGGSKRYTGPAFVGLAAVRAGCDLVYLVGPQRAMDIIASYSPSLITEPLEGDRLEPRHVRPILDMIKEVNATAVVIGPGLWRVPTTRKMIIELVENIKLPMVIDADAIRAISASKQILYKKNVVLTPHMNEFLELTGVNVSTNMNERIKVVKEEAEKINCSAGACPLIPPVTILLKGHVDVISNSRDVALNKTGSPYMTKGGLGDSLSGVCGALLARDVDTFIAACAAAYINGKAGELAVKEKGEGYMTTEVIDKIPMVIKHG